MSQKFLFTINFCFICLIGSAQFYDEFSYSSLHSDSCLWKGQIDSFYINSNHQLQLDAHCGNAYITTCLLSSLEVKEWHFQIQLNFSPSENNRLRVYLAADNENLNWASNAYFLQIGEKLSHDAIELYRIKNDTTTLIGRGEENLVANAFNFNFKVVTNKNNIWNILVDKEKNGNYESTLSVYNEVDMTLLTYFGFWCQYTNSNSKQFYIDNVYFGTIIKDSIPPYLTNVESDFTKNQIKLFFNENIDTTSALNIKHYYLKKPQKCYPNHVEFYKNSSSVILNFDSIFIQDIPNHIYVTQIKDLENNILNKDSILYSHYHAHLYDVIFSELMIKPSPEVSLPNVEYIEIYNSTNYPINVKNWTIKIGNSFKLLPDSILQSKSYTVICSDINQHYFQNSIGINNLQLSDGGQSLLLSNHLGEQIDYVYYRDNWYHDKDKASGGWSLEKSNLEYPCAGAESWSASSAALGGTPCLPNSVINQSFSKESDFWVEIINTFQIILHFSNTLMPSDLENLSAYKISPPLNILSAKTIYPELNTVLLTLTDSLEKNLFYTIEIQKDISDCNQTVISKYSRAKFGIPETPTHGDIIFNEILIKPLTDTDAEYIEFYNRSDKLLNLGDLKIAYISSGKRTTPKTLSDFFLLFPKDYVVFTKNSNNIKENYSCKKPNQIKQSDSLPTLSNSEGILCLYLKNLVLIDSLFYTSNMHNPLLISTEGVSLERIYPDYPTSDIQNWTSAAASVGYGTPTFQNSQYKTFSETHLLDVIPEFFSPDNDGYDDFCTISYQIDDKNCIGSIYIYNSYGQKIKTLANNEILGTTGYYIWNGTNDFQEKVDYGSYIIILEYKPPDKQLKRLKKIVSITVMMKS